MAKEYNGVHFWISHRREILNGFHVAVEYNVCFCKQPSIKTILTLKEPGGRNPPSLRHFLLYLCRLLFFRAETSWLFSFKPCARFKTIFIKVGPRAMTRHCVIVRWVQRKTDFPLKLHTNHVFCLFCLSGYTSTTFYLIYLVYLE